MSKLPAPIINNILPGFVNGNGFINFTLPNNLYIDPTLITCCYILTSSINNKTIIDSEDNSENVSTITYDAEKAIYKVEFSEMIIDNGFYKLQIALKMNEDEEIGYFSNAGVFKNIKLDNDDKDFYEITTKVSLENIIVNYISFDPEEIIVDYKIIP